MCGKSQNLKIIILNFFSLFGKDHDIDLEGFFKKLSEIRPTS
jgi:hypothetical protein